MVRVGAHWRNTQTKYRKRSSLDTCTTGIAGEMVGGKMFTHGGIRKGRYTTDNFYVLDLATLTWRRIKVSLIARALHTMKLVDDKLYVHGGGKKGLKVFDITMEQVEDVEERFGSKVTPKSLKQWGDSLEFHERSNMLLMFGVSKGSEVVGFNVDTRKWDKLETKGTPPNARHRHGSCMHGDYMYIYGGMPQEYASGYLSDLCVLKLGSTPTWSTLVVRHGVGRFGTSISYVNGNLVVYGGKQYGSFLEGREGLLVFDLKRSQFVAGENIVAENTLEPRRFHRPFVQGDEILMVGGRSGDVDLPCFGVLSTLALSFE